MECTKCGGKMVKVKYLHYEDLEIFLAGEHKTSNTEHYEEWLRSLDVNDLVLNLFHRVDDDSCIKKYYLRVVEKKTKNGIKLGRLSKLFKYESGEIVYKDKHGFSLTTTYKILPIDEETEEIIRNYCKNREEFDIDVLNKMITKSIKSRIE